MHHKRAWRFTTNVREVCHCAKNRHLVLNLKHYNIDYLLPVSRAWTFCRRPGTVENFDLAGAPLISPHEVMNPAAGIWSFLFTVTLCFSLCLKRFAVDWFEHFRGFIVPNLISSSVSFFLFSFRCSVMSCFICSSSCHSFSKYFSSDVSKTLNFVWLPVTCNKIGLAYS